MAAKKKRATKKRATKKVPEMEGCVPGTRVPLGPAREERTSMGERKVITKGDGAPKFGLVTTDAKTGARQQLATGSKGAMEARAAELRKANKGALYSVEAFG